MSENSFLEYFLLVLREALTEREQSFVELRYGIMSEEPYTLEQVAQVSSLSRERIRQVLERSVRKIKHRGRRDLRREKATGACASLLQYIERVCKRDEPGYRDRLITFAQEELPYLPPQTYAFPLLLSLLFNDAEMEMDFPQIVMLREG